MNLNKIFVISFLVLVISSYQTQSSILFTLMMNLLMIKGALFMSMPIGLGAFVMGQGMGFFAGNMMGGYMMLRAANTYHNKEKTKWVSHSQWHGPPYHTNTYQNGYDKGKAISDIISLGKHKFNAIGSLFKAFVPSAAPPKYGPPKQPPKYGPPGYDPYPPSYGSYSHPLPSAEPPASYGAPPTPSTSYGEPPPSYGAPSPLSSYGAAPPPPSSSYGVPSSSYGVPPKPSKSYGAPSDSYGAGSGAGGPMSFHDYFPGRQAGRKNGFSNSLLNSIGGGGGSRDLVNRLEEEKNRRSHSEGPPIVSPSGFYTSAYRTPGQEFTGILTNEPTKQGNKYLSGDADADRDDINEGSSTKSSLSSVTSAPNEILESYLEQRLKAEAEKQKDNERKEEAQQLVQMLRKAYLKQLVESLKEEEVSEKTKVNRKLEGASPFANLVSSSLENFLGSRDSRSIEHQQPQQRNYNEAEAEEARQNAQNLIKDLLVNEVFSSAKSSSAAAEEQSTSNKVSSQSPSLDNIDTAEVESITERVLSLTSAEREELVKGLDELGQDHEEAVIQKPANGKDNLFTSSTENSVEGNKRDARDAVTVPAEWIHLETRTYSSDEMLPFGLRVRRHTAGQAGTSTLGGATVSAEEQKQIDSFVEDIRKFFTLLSALDQDQCLQKLVCDVHTNEKDLNTLTQYELNILTTFKLMKALMPEGEEDSSTKYRYAALLGETGQSMDLCQQQYNPCQVDSSQIVQLGSEPVPTPDPHQVAANPLMMNLASLQQQSAAAAGLAGVMSASVPTTARPSTTTTMAAEITTNRPTRRMRTRGTTSTTTMLPLTSEEMASGTQRRNYVETNQYYNTQDNRRKQQQEYFQHQQHYNNHHQHRPSQQRPTSHEVHRKRPEPSSAQGSGFFNYGEFSDFFRGMWSDSMMGSGRGKRRRGQMRPQSQEIYNQYWPAEVMEEIGI